MNDELMSYMYSAGCKEVSLGVESFDIAALEVAYENKFIPALQNSIPI